MPKSTNEGAQPYKYNGKKLDKDHGLNWYDYEARYLTNDIPRFTTMDPLAEKYYSWSPYVYVANNPMRWIDKEGRDPDDPFDAKIGATNDFAKYYNGTSIVLNTEFSLRIYTNVDGTFSYNVARIGGIDWSVPNDIIPDGAVEVSIIHTHTGFDELYGDGSLIFSDTDINGADRKGRNEYLVTPSGELLEYDVKSKETITPNGRATDIPSDDRFGA